MTRLQAGMAATRSSTGPPPPRATAANPARVLARPAMGGASPDRAMGGAKVPSTTAARAHLAQVLALLAATGVATSDVSRCFLTANQRSV